ncbi:D-alanyl-D-alanine carboxypeptidase family protein [Pseudobacillus badius]|uniref:D-alanyl-D-alanine carboxypeptidase family protein n=1 Tax=Bacillus badius TaxID=1455 RepID=UPI003D3300C1
MKKISLIFVLILLINVLTAPIVLSRSHSFSTDLMSESAILIDAKSGKILYEKNAKHQMYPASITKIATAIYAIENGDLDDMVTVSKKAREVEGTRVYLEGGEQVSLKKLIQGLLINSGNDAAVAIAEHLEGSPERFAFKMNKYLKKNIGTTQTNFENPHGLFAPNHVTTASDMAEITRYAMKNKVFREIFGTVKLKWKGTSWNTTLLNHHKLMREIPYEGVTGGKTGFVNESGHTLVTTAKREDFHLIAVTLKAPSSTAAFNDTIQLLDYGYQNYKAFKLTKGSTFHTKQGKSYELTKNLYYTLLNEDKLKGRVTENGFLQISNQEKKVLTSIQLKEEKDMIESKQASLSKVNKLYIVFLIVVALTLGLIVRVCSRIHRL